MRIHYNIISNFFRFLAQSLSYPFFFFNKKSNKNFENKVLLEIIKIISTKKFKKINTIKTKTHKEFSKNLLGLIRKKNLNNFLNFSFIQKIFFVHNRVYIVIQLAILRFSKNWNLWRKLLKENSVGRPIRFFLYPWSSGNLIRQVYIIKKFIEWAKLNFNQVDIIVEFGGGYGCMANIFNKISKKIKYIIIDLKEVSLLQYYYLSMNFHRISLNKEKKSNIFLLNNMNDTKYFFYKHNSKNFFLIMNWSFSEIPIKERMKIEKIIYKFKYILICFQSTFENIDNLKYFKLLKNTLKKNNFKTEIKKNILMKFSSNVNHYYFFAVNRKQ